MSADSCNNVLPVEAEASLASPPPIPSDELEILARMEEQNRMIELDAKSVNGSASKKSDSDSLSLVSENAGERVQTQASLSEDLQEDLWAIWSQIVHNWETEYKRKKEYVKELARRGIPPHFRTIAWQLLSGAEVPAIRDKYAEYMRTQSPHEKVIRRDISRTYPEHEFFREANGRGQLCLFNVMKAYSLHDREVGYCQGSAFIAGLLLLQMPEEEAFAVLLRLTDEYGLRELYKPQMTQLGMCMFQLECLVQDLMPDMHIHFQNMGLDASMYSSSWFLTLFSTQLPLELVNRIMDWFFCEGLEVVFRVGLAILQLCRFDLLILDMEGMLKYFQRDLAQKFESDHELLLTTASQVKYNAKKMKRLEKDYLTKRSKEQEEVVELRRLRTENKILRQRIDYLEQESAALADRLLERQVTLAVEAETCVNVKHELLSLRELNTDTYRRLEEAYSTIRELTNKGQEGRVDADVQVDDCEMIARIHALQAELISVQTRDSDREATIRDLRTRCQEVENANKRLRDLPPDHSVAALQEELISVKMREAEAALSLKEMRQKIADLDAHWTKYMAEYGPAATAVEPPPVESPTETRKFARILNAATAVMSGGIGGQQKDLSPSIRDLQELLMSVRISEAEAVAELKELRQKVMELETQNHVCTNQLRRQDDEYKRLQSEFETLSTEERQLQTHVKEEQHRLHEKEAQLKEGSVLQRLKETELLETIAELRRRVSDLESRNYERWTQDQLNKNNARQMIESTGGDSLDERSGSVDRLSLNSESMDLNAFVAEMSAPLKVPPECLTPPNGHCTPKQNGHCTGDDVDELDAN